MKIWFPVVRGGSGADVHTRRLSGALQKRGVETEVTWFHRYYQFAPFLLQRVSPPSGTSIIHVNTWNGFAFKRNGIPLVVTEHTNMLGRRNRSPKTALRRIFHRTLLHSYAARTFKAASALTAVSRFAGEALDAADPNLERRVIYNFVDTELFRPARGDAARSGAFKLLFVGNLTRTKGAELLDPIMQKLGDSFELHVTSGLRTSSKEWRSRNIKDLGRIHGDRDLVEMYRKHDALLFPSRHEGFGLVLIEAMACGLPVIAATNSAIPEVVEDGRTGILCPTDDVGAFVDACRRLALEPQLGRRMGEAGRRRVQALFSEDIVIPQYLSLYESLVKHPNSRTVPT